MGIKLSNNANATLAAGITSSSTSITVATGQGARFPTLSAGDYFYATLVDTSNNLEIVKCTARSTDVLTVVRAQESTTARAYTTGDRIEIRLTAQTFADATAFTPTTIAQVSDQANTSTGYLDIPSGTTAERPASPGAGMIRHNTTTGNPEWYDPVGAVWVAFSQGASYTVDYLVVAGGGSGDGGGGGAGGYIAASLTVNGGWNISVTVGAGGANVNTNNAGNSGSNSSLSGISISTVTATGGGRAGYTAAGTAGGSGGGGGYVGYSGGGGTAGQGSAGGTGGSTAGGGGGGANAVGGNASGGSGGTGGAGKQWSNGTYYAGGGGGGGGSASGSGGIGGGGAGAAASATSGTANTGGGGGGVYNSYPAGSGGSGIVIIRYSGAQRAAGGTVTSAGGYTYHTFTSSGTFTA